jgi:hypothetical protein
MGHGAGTQAGTGASRHDRYAELVAYLQYLARLCYRLRQGYQQWQFPVERESVTVKDAL